MTHRPTFPADETGAVTVDWVVITAAVAGLGLAVLGVVATGSQSASTDMRDTLTEIEVETAFDADAKVFAELGFDGGDRGAWTAGTVQDVEGFGEILMIPRRGALATMPIDVGDYSHAQVEFDMIFGDSWDNETGTISIAGEEVVVGTHNWKKGEPDIKVIDGSNGTTVTLTRTSTDSGNWKRRPNTDYTYRVSVLAENASDLTLGASTTLNQKHKDEFFGIDNVTVTGTNDPR